METEFLLKQGRNTEEEKSARRRWGKRKRVDYIVLTQEYMDINPQTSEKEIKFLLKNKNNSVTLHNKHSFTQR